MVLSSISPHVFVLRLRQAMVWFNGKIFISVFKMNRNITPEWIDSLKENEIFVFGCRNSGRHFDGASATALRRFGAIMGQREGRQGRSYAIPTIGGSIGYYSIKKSVGTFTKYAARHPELHFLVTPIGCGGGGWSPWIIGPMFRKASKLPNVSLPEEFWKALSGAGKERREAVADEISSIVDSVKEIFSFMIKSPKGSLLYRKMRSMSPEKLYRFWVDNKSDSRRISWTEWPIGKNILWVYPNIEYFLYSSYLQLLINCNTQRAYIVVNSKRQLPLVKPEDIDWQSVEGLPADVIERIKGRRAEYEFNVFRYKDGKAEVMWQVSPDGSYHYLNRYGNGKTTDEKDIRLWGVIDTECRVVEKFHLKTESK